MSGLNGKTVDYLCDKTQQPDMLEIFFNVIHSGRGVQVIFIPQYGAFFMYFGQFVCLSTCVVYN